MFPVSAQCFSACFQPFRFSCERIRLALGRCPYSLLARAACSICGLDFSRLDFSRVDFSRVDFSRVDFSRVEPCFTSGRRL
ncbi:MAG: pentapeptide repeat-containing protein [Planctomycetota bacterium]